jgi:hypothetical protein
MTITTFRHRTVLIAAATAFAGAAASATAQATCRDGQTVPDFGYGSVSCDNCLSVVSRGGLSIPHFSGSPTLHQIRADGPGAGLLSEGDTLLAVDGLPITSDAAADRLSSYRTTPTRLTLRRNGAERVAAISPRPVCVGVATRHTVALRDSVPHERGRIAVEPRATLGVAFECDAGCNLDQSNGRPRWVFSRFPVVAAVDPGSVAANAGLRAGDTLWTIDDTPLTAPAAGEMLGGVGPNASFKLGWRRAGQPYSALVRAWHVESSGPTTGQLEFSQWISGAQITVTGRGRLWTRTASDGTLEIQIDSAIVSVKARRTFE